MKYREQVHCWLLNIGLICVYTFQVGCSNPPGEIYIVNSTSTSIEIRCVKGCTLGPVGASPTPPVYSTIISPGQQWSTQTASLYDVLQQYPSIANCAILVAINTHKQIPLETWDTFLVDSRDTVFIDVTLVDSNFQLIAVSPEGDDIDVYPGMVFWD